MATKALFATLALLMCVLNTRAEEQPSPILTGLPSTTISGYVNVSALWNPSPPPMRFADLCHALSERGFKLRKSGRHYLFHDSGCFVLHLYKTGPFASGSQLRDVRRFLERSAP
jgi:hypothetical protein